MVTSVSSATNSAYLTSTGTTVSTAATVSSGASFANVLANATAQGTVVSISDQAKAAAASSAPVSAQAQADASAQFASLNIQQASLGMGFTDYKTFFATEAAAVSTSQGLPAGQYDFTNLSPKEAQIIAMDAQQNHAASYDDVRALFNYAASGMSYSRSSRTSILSDTTGDILSASLNMQMVTTDLGSGGYAPPKGGINWMLSLQGTSISDSLQKSIGSALTAVPSTSLQSSTSSTAPVTAQSMPAAADQVASFDTSYSNMDHTQAEYAAYYAAGAAAISASQGLPAGQYDFTRISPKEAVIITNDAAANHGASFDSLFGLSEYATLGPGSNTWSSALNNISNVPGNALSVISNMQVSTVGVDGGAFEAPKESLKWLLALQGAQISDGLQQYIDSLLAA